MVSTRRNSSFLFSSTVALYAACAIPLSSYQACAQASAEKSNETIRIIRSEKLTNLPGQSLTAVTVNYAPGGKSLPHHHAGSVFAYVLTGAIRSENSATGPAQVYHAGESFFEPDGSEHLISENASDTEPASLLAVFIAPEDATLTAFDFSSHASVPTTAHPAQLVDALNLVFGKQTTNRAVHAKGVVLEGIFTPSLAAAGLSKAPHFQNAVPVTIRFSDFAGIPNVSDIDPLANPRGMAIKFHLSDGTDTDLVTHSFNGFPAPTAEEFRQFLIALGTSGPGAPHPTPAETYLAAHPIARAFLENQSPPPVSFATLTYFGVNSFKFTNSHDEAQIGRYRIEPQLGNQFLSADTIANKASDYLEAEIRTRISHSPIRFWLKAQLAQPLDKIEDPSIAWPDSREVVDLGVIEITSVVPNNVAVERKLLFLPASLPQGIEPADPMIQIRSDAYPVSFSRRHQTPPNSAPALETSR